MEYPTKEGYTPGEWNPDLPVDPVTNHINVEGHIIGNYASYIFTDVLGFCACGMPDLTIVFIRDALQHVDNKRLKVWDNNDPYSLSDWNEDGKKLFKSEVQEYFMYYWMDKEELTNHGGSVPGWLDPKGLQILEKLNEFGDNLHLSH